MNKIVAIHQPNFFPWLGFFHKIVHCDVFIFLDSVQLPKKGGSYPQRVKLLVSGLPKWMTAPINRPPHGTILINEASILNSMPWKTKLLRSIEQSYGKTDFFDGTFTMVNKLLADPIESLAQFNINTIKFICDFLEMPKVSWVKSSQCEASGASNELLINLTKEVGGTHYLCGGGAGGYQNDELFAHENIQVVYQAFEHPVYPQGRSKDFVPGLSILDALFHLGPEKTRKLLFSQPLPDFSSCDHISRK